MNLYFVAGVNEVENVYKSKKMDDQITNPLNSPESHYKK